MKKALKGFTLIELLIVVAIIGILAAVAVPNFLNAQMRAKVVRAVSDMKAVGMAISTYKLDNNEYPENAYGYARRVTTPIAYIGSIPEDFFNQYYTEIFGYPPPYWYSHIDFYPNEAYYNAHMVYSPNSQFMVYSYGPDTYSTTVTNDTGKGESGGLLVIYDMSNGIRSWGSLFHFGQ